MEAKALDTEMIRLQLQAFLDVYNKSQPTYRRITGLVIRKNPFIRSTTKKIRRQDVLIDEPQAKKIRLSELLRRVFLMTV